MEPKTVSYWWVNQNKTYEHERRGGYMWSPKNKTNGDRNQFYENMTKVIPGDVVFSFAKQKIPCIGLITSKGYEALKPQEFGASGINWEQIGWKVDVKYFDLQHPVRPKDFINDLRKTLPKKYSPLQSNGDGLQGVYLASVPIEMARILFDKIGAEASIFTKTESSLFFYKEDMDRMEGDKIEESIRNNLSLDKTEKETVIKARMGQGIFRQNLEEIESQCRVTKVKNPNHLIAGHIKPWAKCKDNSERLDGHNGLLLAPHIDHLFDKGYISFLDNGDMMISPYADLNALVQMGVKVEQPVNVGSFTDKQKLYLTYHRDFVFKK